MAPGDDRKVTGLVAATFTPLDAQGEVNLSVIGPYVDYLTEKQGIKGIFVNGTTGESMSLSVAERKVLAEEWCLRAKGRMDNVIIHVGCMSLKDSQDLARHAAKIGADGIAAISPSFFKPKTAEALRRFLQEVASAAPTLPFYYYQIPSFTGVNVPVKDVIEDIEKLIPSFRGVKFTGGDLLDFGQCVGYSQPHWSVLYGMDEQLLAGLAMGANGAVGSTYNYMGCYVDEMISAFETKDLVKARTIQFKIQELLNYAIKLGFDTGVNKQLMSDVSGLHLGPPRLPLMPCSPDLAQLLLQKYHSIFD
ncbi:N-acetylneuraminate lyase [Poecilia latipinna]|uniref:N-acetylneuraminate lyase n=1 Tax=Poecilia latipinna TaxID=48699 RepID=A0A3B3V7E1_9TELE|nr:PREDICTED: N-acetylneuraminate lyase [Poecilia latipinna]XP_014910286.1 PREDICTED: N-acetylneuraminate lyase [Poecilia latipinna]XP_014910288.1 PREDICTED: N-acetylneuraminate lyase [Poecilia latipinna]